MTKLPIAAPHTEGRIFGSDWSIANVATLLRANARRGMWRSTGTTGGYAGKINQNYLRTVSARHLPTGMSLIFMRLEDGNGWYASLCFSDADHYLPWNPDIAEQWLWALFDQERPRVVRNSPESAESANPSVQQFTLAKLV